METYLYKDLYVGDIASRRKRKIIKNIKNNKKQLGVYIIALPSNNQNLLDIYPSLVLTQKYYSNRRINIVGICKSREEAFNMVQSIIMDCYNEYSNVCLIKMFEKKGFSPA